MTFAKRLVISASTFMLAVAPAFAQGAPSSDVKPSPAVPAQTYEKPDPSANPADHPASTGTQGGALGVSGGKEIPAAGTGAQVGPGR